ncbi:MAG: hypothetical protein C4334_07940 [Pyrinomonas sp.]|uniref:DegT/DnrJ/EryC1/StrS family aminotransferase n=1 Tax=Pyrinomonas sp. TaxID=2080306 RepID=UPI003321A82A
MKLRAIARYGIRSVPGDERVVIEAFRRGAAISGPAIGEFEARFAAYHAVAHAVATSYGRMACYYILRALDLAPGSEVIVPALTFWVVPEMVRRAGLRPVFVDVDARTFNIAPEKIEAAITCRTRAILPTHLYGQPCQMEPILRLAEKYDLAVIEDCAQAVGARYRGRLVGTFGTAAFFSFQMLKGINTYGGGMAITDDAALAARIRAQVEAEPPPSTSELARRFALGYLARCAISPRGYALWGFPLQAAVSLFGHYDLSRFVWEKIRPLAPFPAAYHRRYTNAQAMLGLRALAQLDDANARTRAHAERYTRALANHRQVRAPAVIADAEHVYYQYSIYVSDPARTARRMIRRAIDCETTHVDLCSELPLFAEFAADCPGARQTTRALQLPVYARLHDEDVERVLRVLCEVTADLPELSQEILSASNLAHRAQRSGAALDRTRANASLK